MNKVRQELSERSLDELADWMAMISPGSYNEMTVRAEFLRRQTLLQAEHAQALKDAAHAAKETAVYTKHSARYLLWSVLVIVISSVLPALFNMMK